MKYRWLLVALLWVVWLLNYLDRQVIFSVLPLLQNELKLSSTGLGLLSGVFLWVYAAASPFAGYAADRFGRKRAVVLSLLIWSVVTWATAHATNLTFLLTARAVMGLSEAFYLPAGLALIAAWHGDRTRAKATGLHYTGGYLGMVLGGVLGSILAVKFGWRVTFSVLGLIGTAYAILLAFTLRDREGQSPPKFRFDRASIEIFRLPGYGTMFIVFGLVSVGNWMVYTWLPLYIYERFQMGLEGAGFTATFYLQAGAVAGIVIGGWLGDWWSGRHIKGRLWTQAVGLAAAAPFLCSAGITDSVVVLSIGMVVFGIGRGVYDSNTMPALCGIAPENLRATGYGWFNLIGPLAGGAVAAGAGALKDTIGLGGALAASGALLGLSAILLTFIKPYEH